MSLTILPPVARQWFQAALLCWQSDAHDHPDHDLARAGLAELAAQEDSLRAMATQAARPDAFNAAADAIAEVAALLTDEAWRWEDDRDDREARDRHGNKLDRQRMTRSA